MSDQTNNDEPRDARDTIESQAEAGDIEAAIATSRTIEDTEKREDTLRDVAKSLAKDEQGDAAIALAKGIEILTIRVWALEEIGAELRSYRPTEALRALGAQMHTEESLEPEQRPVDRFLEGLAKLTEATGVTVDGCGCCGSPFSTSVSDRDAKGGRYVMSRNRNNIEFVNGRVCEALRWCEEKSVRYDILYRDGTLAYFEGEESREHHEERWEYDRTG